MSKRLIIVIFSLIFLSFCTSCRTIHPDYGIPSQVRQGESEIGMKILALDNSLVLLQFTNATDYTHIVQEIHLEDGQTLVECFEWDGWVRDRHTWSANKHSRWMKVYAANVEGTDDRNGFAHLPQNMDGSVKTEIKWNFNAAHQWEGVTSPQVGVFDSRTGLWHHPDNGVAHKTKGRITKQSDNWFIWTIIDSGDRVEVLFPGGLAIWEHHD